ncbi:aldehyde reductase [Botrytis cinerea]
MVRRKSLKVQEMESRLAEAVLGVQNGKYKSSYEAAKELGLSKDTVTRRVKGGSSRSEARQLQQKLSAVQENVLLKWIKQLTISGYSPGHQLLKELAEELRSKRTYNLDCPSFDSLELPPQHLLGHEWVPRFIKRHPHLTVVIGRRIESVRMDGATRETCSTWFDAYQKAIQDYGIQKKDEYNMDESGHSIGTMESTRIIIDSTLRTKHQAHPGRQEWISMVECICADGSILPPLGIFKARADVCHHQNIESAWRGAGLHPFNPQRVFRTLGREFTPEVEISKEPTQFDIFNQVFVNSSPPDVAILQTANNLLNSTIENDTTLSTPVRQYIRKLTIGSEQLRAQSIVHQHDANNLRAIMKKRTIRKKGKRLVLKGHFHISTQELCDAVVEAEKATKVQTMKKGKGKGKVIEYETETEEDIGEEVEDESESDIGDCIIVDC